MTSTPKQGEIARRIQSHLRYSFGQDASARATGNRVVICYGWPDGWRLTTTEAWHYLQWLDAGNKGTHLEALGKLTGRDLERALGR
jgi:hypothetical protein